MNRRHPQEFSSHPVVLVTAMDATQYCKWLKESLIQDLTTPFEIKNLLNSGWIIRLPTEQEWEKAARGGDEREWPWGNNKLRNISNTVEEGLFSTSPVGIFPEGASPYGAYDMSGNVFEWTIPDDLHSANLLVLRGGSWAHSLLDAQCNYRFLASSINRTSYIGFRIVITRSEGLS
jgi:formylglycine-generating enzyme required for sulfatase activity